MVRPLICLLVLAVPAAALGRPDDDAMRAKVRDRVRALRTARLIELIDLDEASAARLFTVLNRYDDQLEPVLRDMGEARREMRAQIESGKPDAAKLNKLVDRVIAGREKMQKIENERLREIRKVMTPVQMARIVVVLPQVDQFIQRQLKRALKRGGPGGPGGGGRPIDPFGDD